TDAVTSVGYPQGGSGGNHVHVEPAFADIDSCIRLACGLLFGRFLALHAGLAPHHLFRTRAEGRTDQAHPRCSPPKGHIGPAHPRRGRWPPASTHLPACAESASQYARGEGLSIGSSPLTRPREERGRPLPNRER